MKNYTSYFPIFGMALYLILFTVAAVQYPGGSYNDSYFQGFSVFHNFLCDLMHPITESGALNPARPMAILAHLVLSLTMVCFFYILPEIFDVENKNTSLIRWFGMITMTVFFLMYTQYHDLIVIFTGLFGTIALIPFFIELSKYPMRGISILAYSCFALSIIVYISYNTKIGFYYLPFLQKITFLFDATWVIWVSFIVMKKRQVVVHSKA
jgi:hypothetical protein